MKKKDDFKRPLWKLKNSCDSLYCSGLELSLQYLRGMPICVTSSLQEEDEALGSGRGLTCLTFLKCKTINDSTCVIVWLSTEIRWVKHSVPHLTFTKWFVNKSLLLDVQGYHYHLYWITLNRVSTFLEYILIFAYYLKNKETSILISFPLSILSCKIKISPDWCMLKCVYPSEKHLNNPNLFYDEMTAAAAAKSLQSCPTLCDPTDGSPPGSPIPGILQTRTLEWVAISFSNAWKWKVKVKSLSCVRLLATPWTAAHQGPPSMGFSRQEYWSGVPLPCPMLTLSPPKSFSSPSHCLYSSPDSSHPWPGLL